MAKIKYTDQDGNVYTINTTAENDLPLLDLLENEGVDYPFSCRAGACDSCKIKVNKGAEYIHDYKHGEQLISRDDNGLKENEFLSCLAGIKTEALSTNSEIELEYGSGFM